MGGSRVSVPMVTVDDLPETVLALAALGLVANIAVAVLVWLYAAVAIGGSAVGAVLAAVFVVDGTAIVWGYLRLYLA